MTTCVPFFLHAVIEVSDVTGTVKGPVSKMISLQPVGLTVNPKHEPETEHLQNIKSRWTVSARLSAEAP